MEIGVAENLVEQAKIKSTQMNDSLNKKWWIPREESLGKEGNTSKKLVKDVLIYIKDNFEQFPRGGLDLNAITINIDDDWDKALNKLESIAVLFDLRLDEDTGETIMFFDVRIQRFA